MLELTGLLEKLPLANALLSLVTLWLLTRVYLQVRETNGRLTRLETWQAGDIKLQDERYNELRREP